MATLQLTVISAVLSSDAGLDPEPRDIFAIVKFGKQQRRTKTAYDHGKSPVWNETLTFTFNDQDYSKFIFVQLFRLQPDADELLGVSRISVPTSGEIEDSLHVLVSPSKGEIGTLKATGKWESVDQHNERHSSSTGSDMAQNEQDDVYRSYPLTAPNYDAVASSFSNLAVGESQMKERYPSSPAYPSNSYPPQRKAEELSTLTSTPYPPPLHVSSESYPGLPYPPNPDAYPPYPDNKKFSSSLDRIHTLNEREEGESSNVTMRGLGDTGDRGHHSHLPSGHLPFPMHGGGYPPYGYPPPHGFHSQYGHPAPVYPPPPGFPPPPHHVSPSPYGYPPEAYPYSQSHPLLPYGYPPQMSYPNHSGHDSYIPGMYVGHSSSGKHKKHNKHHKMKMPKHSTHHYDYGYSQPHPMYGHHQDKHKKHK